MDSLPQQLASAVMAEECRRAKRPRAQRHRFASIRSPQVRDCIAGQGVEGKVVPSQGGHVISCEIISDFNQLRSLDRSRVQVGTGSVVLRVQNLEEKLTATGILDLVAERLADEEIYNDTRRVQTAKAHPERPPPQRQTQLHKPHRLEAVDAEPEETDGEILEPEEQIAEDWPLAVAAVDRQPQHPSPALKASSTPSFPKGGGANKCDKRKSSGKGDKEQGERRLSAGGDKGAGKGADRGSDNGRVC